MKEDVSDNQRLIKMLDDEDMLEEYANMIKDDVSGSIFAAMEQVGLSGDAEMKQLCEEKMRELGLVA